MGWSRAGNTRQKYQHYYNDDSFDAMLTVMDGLTPPANSANQGKKGLLRPKQCPNCSETNKPESRFCVKCKFVLSFDAYNETIKSADEKEEELEQMRQNQQRLWDNMTQMQNIIDSLWKQMKAVPQDNKSSFPESKNILIGLKPQQE